MSDSDDGYESEGPPEVIQTGPHPPRQVIPGYNDRGIRYTAVVGEPRGTRFYEGGGTSGPARHRPAARNRVHNSCFHIVLNTNQVNHFRDRRNVVSTLNQLSRAVAQAMDPTVAWNVQQGFSRFVQFPPTHIYNAGRADLRFSYPTIRAVRVQTAPEVGTHAKGSRFHCHVLLYIRHTAAVRIAIPPLVTYINDYFRRIGYMMPIRYARVGAIQVPGEFYSEKDQESLVTYRREGSPGVDREEAVPPTEGEPFHPALRAYPQDARRTTLDEIDDNEEDF